MRTIWHVIQGFLGSRLGIAASGLFFVAFFAHMASAPTRLPPFGTLTLSELGLVPSWQAELDRLLPQDQPGLRGRVSAVAREKAADSAERAKAKAKRFAAERPDAIRLINQVGCLASFLMLMLTVQLNAMAERRRAAPA